MISMAEAMICMDNAEELPFELYWDDTSIGHNGPAKNPQEMPVAFLDGHTLIFDGTHANYTVQLYDATGLAYLTVVTSLSSMVVFPDSLSGTYELRIVLTGYYFSTIIEL